MKLDAQVFHYSENINRVHPRQLIERATDLQGDFPNKRFIVHMMVPHTPYHSTRARELRKRVVESKNIKFSMTDIDEGRSDTMSEEYDFYSLLNACERGYISDDELMHVYKENVEIGIDYAKKLLEKIYGKTIITSDHGELLGERIPPLFLKEYGHGEGIYHDSLRSVPYLIIDSGDRKHITSENPIERADQHDGELDARLRALGYK
jgi:hypothetical protein